MTTETKAQTLPTTLEELAAAFLRWNLDVDAGNVKTPEELAAMTKEEIAFDQATAVATYHNQGTVQ